MHERCDYCGDIIEENCPRPTCQEALDADAKLLYQDLVAIFGADNVD